MEEVVTLRDAISPTALDRVKAAVFAEAAPRRAPEEALYALTAIFRREGIEQLRTRLPALGAFFDLVDDRRTSRPLWSWRERWLAWLARLQPNAFVVRLLLIPPGSGLAPHVDSTLRNRTSVDRPPRLVSVLYLDFAASWRGGRLHLHRAGAPVADLSPAPGTLVHFRGDLTHAVTPFIADPEVAGGPTLRASLVCEQYCFADGVLNRLPRFTMAAPAKFASCLREARDRTAAADAAGADSITAE